MRKNRMSRRRQQHVEYMAAYGSINTIKQREKRKRNEERKTTQSDQLNHVRAEERNTSENCHNAQFENHLNEFQANIHTK